MIVFLFGPQGSGKSTQGKILAQKLGIPYIAAGDIAREVRLEDSDEGRQARELNDQGKLIPSATLYSRLEKKLSSPEAAGGFILDSPTRSPEQLQFMDELRKKLNFKIDKAILINLSEEQGIERLHKRAEIEKRVDETDEAIKQRLQIYHTQTKPILKYYQDLGVLVEIDGGATVEDVEKLVWEAIQK